MTEHETKHPRIASLRPLVRYVDEIQAVIDLWLRLEGHEDLAAKGTELELLIEMRGPADDGFEYRRRLRLRDGAGMVRFVVPDPERWWPAGMGEQWLYDLSVTLLAGEKMLDARSMTIGLTSVRVEQKAGAAVEPELLINGRPCRIQSVTPVGPDDESRLLPASGDCLLVVRDHIAPKRLFDAADRAGVLVIQSLPMTGAEPAAAVAARQSLVAAGRDDMPELASIDLLTAHPCLAGWFVSHVDAMTERVILRMRDLDPTHNVFRSLPQGHGTGNS